MASSVFRPAREIPVICEADVCVVGGGCTGVFAAVRAARLGARVVLVERGGAFGGVATGGLVNIWHSLLSTDHREQVIAGLTDEVQKTLLRDGTAERLDTDAAGIRFNPSRLAVAFDRLLREAGVKLMLHTLYTGISRDGDRIDAVFVENKDGCGAIRAGFFIDASGDGDVARDLHLPSYRHPAMQPPSSCFLLQNVPGKPFSIGELIREHGAEFGLDDDWGWSGPIPGLPSVSFRADNHIFGVDCSKAEELTLAELEGRRKAAAFSDLLKKYADPGYELAALCQCIGIRDTVHYETEHRITERELLTGVRFPHTVLKGTYRIDVHHQQDNGITFKYLDGRTETVYGKDTRVVLGNWREEEGITGTPATFYSAPWEMLVQGLCPNFIAAGRMLHGEESAFGALRVMVNLNQLGEAAGVGGVLALSENVSIRKLDGERVCAALRRGGSAV